MEFEDIVMRRYATKKFDRKKIPEARISKLIELVRFAHSAFKL
jgi:nitroreductase/dihydropteridine reductase